MDCVCVSPMQIMCQNINVLQRCVILNAFTYGDCGWLAKDIPKWSMPILKGRWPFSFYMIAYGVITSAFSCLGLTNGPYWFLVTVNKAKHLSGAKATFSTGLLTSISQIRRDMLSKCMSGQKKKKKKHVSAIQTHCMVFFLLSKMLQIPADQGRIKSIMGLVLLDIHWLRNQRVTFDGLERAANTECVQKGLPEPVTSESSGPISHREECLCNALACG